MNARRSARGRASNMSGKKRKRDQSHPRLGFSQAKRPGTRVDYQLRYVYSSAMRQTKERRSEGIIIPAFSSVIAITDPWSWSSLFADFSRENPYLSIYLSLTPFWLTIYLAYHTEALFFPLSRKLDVEFYSIISAIPCPTSLWENQVYGWSSTKKTWKQAEEVCMYVQYIPYYSTR